MWTTGRLTEILEFKFFTAPLSENFNIAGARIMETEMVMEMLNNFNKLVNYESLPRKSYFVYYLG